MNKSDREKIAANMKSGKGRMITSSMIAECPHCGKKSEFGKCLCGCNTFMVRGGSLIPVCVNCGKEYVGGGRCKHCGGVIPPEFYLPAKKGCFIATAVYESEYSEEVVILRNFRDEILMSNVFGRLFIKLYYSLSPSVAKVIANNSKLKKNVKKYVTNPIVKRIAFKNNADRDK